MVKSSSFNIRFFILSAFMLFSSMVVNAQGIERYVMRVELVDSSDGLSFDLDRKPVVTFGKDSIDIKVDEDLEYIGYSKINRIYFDVVNNVPTDIQDAISDVKIQISSDKIVFSNIASDSKVSAFSIDGKSIPVDYYSFNNGIVINISTYNKGIYIFRVNNHSFKIIKK